MTKKRELRTLLGSIPMPLAQLGKRALNAQPGLERHNSAFYLCEAALKLAASGRIAAWIDAALEPKSRLAQGLETLALPSLGHWFGFLRDVSDALDKAPATKGKPLAAPAKRLGKTPAEWRAVPAFAKAAVEAGAVKPEIGKNGEKRGVLGFFEVLVAYRNEVIGHGAQRGQTFYEQLGDALLEAAAEVLTEPELFGGLHLVVARIEVEAGQKIKTRFKELTGLAALPLDEPADGAVAGQLYFTGEATRVPLYPLVRFDEANERFAFLNKTAGGKKDGPAEVKRVEFLDYVTGESEPDAEAIEPFNRMLAKLRAESVAPNAPGAEAAPSSYAAPREEEAATRSKKWLVPAIGAGVLGAGALVYIVASDRTPPTPPSSAAASSSSAATPTSASTIEPKAAPVASVAWTRTIGGAGSDKVKSASARADGAFIALDVEGKIELDGKTLESAGGRDALVVSLGADGKPKWSTTLTNQEDLDVRVVETKGAGALVAGLFERQLQAGDKKVDARAPWGIFLADIDAAGAVTSLRQYGEKDLSLFAAQLDVRVAPGEETLIAGGYGGSLDLGCGAMKAEGFLDGFAAKLDSAGKCLWMKRLGDAGVQAVEDIDTELSGDVTIAGELSGTIDLGGTTLTSEGGIDVFVAKLNPKGEHKYSRRFGSGSALQGGVRLAVHDLGAAVVAGWFDGTVDFGTGPLTASEGHDIFVVRLDAVGRTVFAAQWKITRPRCKANECLLDRIGLAIDAEGNALLAVPFEGTADLGGDLSVTSAGAVDLLVAELSPTGAVTRAVSLGAADAQCAPPGCWLLTATHPSGAHYVGGAFEGGLGLSDAKSAGGADGFIARLSP